MLHVAAALEAAGREVEVLDLSGVTNHEEAAESHARLTSAVVFGFTATTPQLPAAARIAAAIRRVRPDAKLVIGGPHATVTCAAVKKEKAPGRASRARDRLLEVFDVVVAGDGERAIFLVLDAPKGAVIDADDKASPLFLGRKEVATASRQWPARHLVDLDSYKYEIDGVRATSLISQLGCPFACAFCSGRASPMLRQARFRSPDDVVAELRFLYEAHGYRAAMTYDDELNVSPQMPALMRGIAALARELGTEFHLRGFVKSELFNAEQAEAMRAAGFRWLLCGFESGSPRILENIRKQATVEDNDRMLATARAAGIKVKALMSIGHAGESPETVRDTLRWLIDRKVDDFDCTVITPYPGSPYFDEAEPVGPGVWRYTAENGDRLYQEEIDYAAVADVYKGKPGEYAPHVWTDEISAEELAVARDHVEATVRQTLGLPFYEPRPGIAYEASMGQSKLPSHVLRASRGSGGGEEAA